MARKNSLRLPYYSYRTGWFLITFNTHRFRPTLGRLTRGTLVPSLLGEFALEAWRYTLEGKPDLTPSAFQLMPNHLHAVVGLYGHAGTLGTLVSSLKSRATRNARRDGCLGENAPMWHRGYHARWLPDQAAVGRAVAYVEANPKRGN